MAAQRLGLWWALGWCLSGKCRPVAFFFLASCCSRFLSSDLWIYNFATLFIIHVRLNFKQTSPRQFQLCHLTQTLRHFSYTTSSTKRADRWGVPSLPAGACILPAGARVLPADACGLLVGFLEPLLLVVRWKSLWIEETGIAGEVNASGLLEVGRSRWAGGFLCSRHACSTKHRSCGT